MATGIEPEVVGSSGSSAVDSGASSEPSLAESIGDFFGDMDGSDFDESPVSETPSAGAPPASDASAGPESPAGSGPEGTAAAERPGAPPGDAAAAVSDDAAQGSVDDLLKDATPFTYTVGGQTRTAEGIRRLGDDGAIVDADYLPKLERVFTERDHLFETQQKTYHELQDLERYLAWPVTDAKGVTTTLTGRQAADAVRWQAATSTGELQVLRALMADPGQLFAMLDFPTAQDGTVSVVHRADRQDWLKTAVENARLKAGNFVRAHLANASKPAPPPAPKAADYAEVTIAELAKQYPDLTAEDRQLLTQQFPLYTETQNGQLVYKPELVAAMQHLAQRSAAAKQAVSATTDAAKANAAKLAAAARPSRPAPSTPARPNQRPPSREQVAEQHRGDMWDRMERASAAVARR